MTTHRRVPQGVCKPLSSARCMLPFGLQEGVRDSQEIRPGFVHGSKKIRPRIDPTLNQVKEQKTDKSKEINNNKTATYIKAKIGVSAIL